MRLKLLGPAGTGKTYAAQISITEARLVLGSYDCPHYGFQWRRLREPGLRREDDRLCFFIPIAQTQLKAW